MNYFQKIILIVILFFITSCSNIIYKKTEKINFNSYPPGAEIYINDKSTGQFTPSTIEVEKRNSYKEPGFNGVKYELRKEGYEPYVLKKKYKYHIWSLLFGNYFLGSIATVLYIPVVLPITGEELTDEITTKAVNAGLIVAGAGFLSDLLSDDMRNLPNDIYGTLEPKGLKTNPENASNILEIIKEPVDAKVAKEIMINVFNKNKLDSKFINLIKDEAAVNFVNTYIELSKKGMFSINKNGFVGESIAGFETMFVNGVISLSKTESIDPNQNKIASSNSNKSLVYQNSREEVYQKMIAESKPQKPNQKTTSNKINSNNAITTINNSANKISNSLNSQEIDSSKLTFRRSSLYTLITNKEDREYEEVIVNAFGNAALSEKFNDHNLGPYRIPIIKEVKSDNIPVTEYLNKNNVARDIVAKWFNRSQNGGFNMNLVAERGNYDASEMRVNIAKGSARGLASISDAGEELIGNTFVIVHDFKFTNKEEVAEKTKTGLQIAKFASDYLPGSDMISTASDLGSVAVTVAGKGYIVRTTSHLYRLVWNDSIANIFYNEMWTEDGNIDQKKKELFENTDLFKLKYIGYEVAFADVQSTVFTDKTNEDLIKIATTKASDAAIAKLQRKFEEFRTKSPLYTGYPITAKIGLKEGLEPGDKFEVLERTIDQSTGRTKYIRKGIITVDGTKIWDNRFMAAEERAASATSFGALDRTYFKGSNKYYSGMLIRQIK